MSLTYAQHMRDAAAKAVLQLHSPFLSPPGRPFRSGVSIHTRRVSADTPIPHH